MIKKYSTLQKQSIRGDINSPEFKNWFKGSVLQRDGYPIILYHQTSREAENLILEKGYDLSKGRARLSDEVMPDGIFLKYDEKDIGIGAREKADRTQMPLYVRLVNPLRVSNRAQLLTSLMDCKEYLKIYSDLKKYDRESLNRNNELWKELKASGYGNLEENIIFQKMQEQIDTWGEQIKFLATKARAIATNYLKSLGYDGLIMEEDEGGWGRTVKTVVVFSTAQIRSAIPGQEIPIQPKL